MFTDIHGPWLRTHNNAGNATQAATVILNCKGYNSVMLLHTKGAGTAYSSIVLRSFVSGAGPGARGTYSTIAAHPAPSGNSDWGLNVKAAGVSANFVSLFKGITDQIGVGIVRTSGTHSLDVLFLNT